MSSREITVGSSNLRTAIGLLGELRYLSAMSSAVRTVKEILEDEEHVRLVTWVHDLLNPILIADRKHLGRVIFLVFFLLLSLA